MKSRVLSGVLSFLTFASVLVAALPAPAQEEETYTFDGGGWGHGVGMSQFGAYGMALDGYSVQEILNHYYTGTEIGAMSLDTVKPFLVEEEMPLWVGLFQDDATVTFQVDDGTATLCYGGPDEPFCDLETQIGELWQYQFVAGGCQFAKRNTAGKFVAEPGTFTSECGASATPTTPDTIINLVFLKFPLFKSGVLRIREDIVTPSDTDGGLHAIWQTGVEDYVRGIAEMPDSWGGPAPAALQAQAIAARTYAVDRVGARGAESTFSFDRQGLCWCNILDDTRDQVFNGWSGEVLKPNSAQAARETEGQVVLFDGTTAQTYYFSSSFGETENVEDVFTQTLGYLRSVDDHWAVAESVKNDFANWSVTYSESELAERLSTYRYGPNWGRVDAVTLVDSAPGSRISVEGVDLNGGYLLFEYRGEDLRTPLSLRSPQITAINGVGGTSGLPTFTDIDGNVHEADIIELAKLGITKGCNPPDNDRFCPDGLVTRGQMAAFLVRALGLTTGADADVFTDDNDSIFERDIERMWVAGITKGCNPPDNDRFCPDDPVTRDQMAAFLGRAFGYSDTGAGNFFFDDDGSIFENDIDRLFVAGVTKGCNPPDNDRYCPAASVTRAQMASFLIRALTGLEG